VSSDAEDAPASDSLLLHKLDVLILRSFDVLETFTTVLDLLPHRRLVALA